MPSMISTKHPLLVDKIDQIRRARDAHKGTDAIKCSNHPSGLPLDEEYLPRLGGQTLEDYEAYKRRAVFYAAMNRTVVALVGALCRKPAEVDNGDALKAFMEDVTGTGVCFDEFLKRIETEILTSGRVIVCVDRMDTEDSNRPYLIWYKSEECTNWFTTKAANFAHTLNNVVFKESYYEPCEDNKYKQEVRDQYREYVLEDNGRVTVNVHRPANKSNGSTPSEMEEYIIHESRVLTNRGKDLGFLPVSMIVSSGEDYEVPTPPLLDLVDVNLAHYRNSADFEHGLHWTALPTPWFSGLTDTTSNIAIGSGAAIILPDPSASAGFLEFTGSGLTQISGAMKHKEQLMSTLGARMLGSGMDQSTSAEVVRINVSGEISALINIAKSIGRCVSRTMRMVAMWENVKGSDSINVHINEDYVDTKLAAADINALLGAFQGGALSLDTLLWNLEQGERIPVGRSVEEELALIEVGAQQSAEAEMGEGGEPLPEEVSFLDEEESTGDLMQDFFQANHGFDEEYMEEQDEQKRYEDSLDPDEEL